VGGGRTASIQLVLLLLWYVMISDGLVPRWS
jgi:hypothetical protein